MYLSDVFTIPSGLSGTPAISIPCGLAADDGLPVGFQFMGRLEDERTVLRAAFALEQELGFTAKSALDPAAAGRGVAPAVDTVVRLGRHGPIGAGTALVF